MQGVIKSSGTYSAAPYVREAFLEEYNIAARLCSLAFINIPLINWIGSLKEPIALGQPFSKDQHKHVEILYYFYQSLIISTRILGGRVMVVAVPNTSTGIEDVGAVGLWIPPGKLHKLDSLSILLRSRQYRTVFGTLKNPGGWGFTAIKVCILIIFQRFLLMLANYRGLRSSYSRKWRNAIRAIVLAYHSILEVVGTLKHLQHILTWKGEVRHSHLEVY